MNKFPIQDNDLESLENSLAAIENENTSSRHLRKYGNHPSWIYYYIAFLGLFLFLIILVIINFAAQPEEPVFLTLQEHVVKNKSLPMDVVNTPKETPFAGITVEQEAAKFSESLNYHFYIPDELQRVANLISGESSEDYNLIKAEVYSLLGWFGNNQKFKKEGLDFANRLIQTNAHDFKNQRALALAHLSNGHYDRTRNILSGLKQPHSDSLKDWMDGYMLVEAGRIQGGISKLELVRKNDPSFYPASYILMQQYLKLSEFPKAYEIAQFWKGKSLSHLSFVQLMAEILDRQQQYVEMINYLTPFGSIYPKDWTIIYYLGKGNAKLQKREIAKTYFNKILSSQENYLVDQIGQANFELGKIALYENNYKDSITQLQLASQKLPNDTNIRFYLASAYFKSEDYEKAIEIYQQMLLKNQNDPKIRIYLGMAYFELGQYQSAEKNFYMVLNQGSNEPLLFYYLAKVEDQKGNLPKAKEYLQKVITIEPQHPLAIKMLEKINSMLVPEAASPASNSEPQQLTN
jgi:pentatricopeptide repeat protein